MLFPILWQRLVPQEHYIPTKNIAKILINQLLSN
jgi:hypothetical protein